MFTPNNMGASTLANLREPVQYVGDQLYKYYRNIKAEGNNLINDGERTLIYYNIIKNDGPEYQYENRMYEPPPPRPPAPPPVSRPAANHPPPTASSRFDRPPNRPPPPPPTGLNSDFAPPGPTRVSPGLQFDSQYPQLVTRSQWPSHYYYYQCHPGGPYRG